MATAVENPPSSICGGGSGDSDASALAATPAPVRAVAAGLAAARAPCAPLPLAHPWVALLPATAACLVRPAAGCSGRVPPAAPALVGASTGEVADNGTVVNLILLGALGMAGCLLAGTGIFYCCRALRSCRARAVADLEHGAAVSAAAADLRAARLPPGAMMPTPPAATCLPLRQVEQPDHSVALAQQLPSVATPGALPYAVAGRG